MTSSGQNQTGSAAQKVRVQAGCCVTSSDQNQTESESSSRMLCDIKWSKSDRKRCAESESSSRMLLTSGNQMGSALPRMPYDILRAGKGLR